MSPEEKRDKLSPITKTTLEPRGRSPTLNHAMFINYTNEQIRLIESISNKIEEAKTFMVSGFKSPCALSRKLKRESCLTNNTNQNSFAVTNRNFSPDSLFINTKHTELFKIRKLHKILI